MMTHLHWQPVVYNVRYPREAVERREGYVGGCQVQAFGDIAVAGMLTTPGLTPAIWRMFLADLRTLGFMELWYERAGDREPRRVRL